MNLDLVHLVVEQAKAESLDGPEPIPLCTPWPKCCSGSGCYLMD